MKDDLNASEKRLIAALDRIDRFIDHTARDRATSPVGAVSGDADLLAENRRLSDELAALHDNQAALMANFETRLAQANERLHAAGDEAARLSAANEALAQANRALVSAQPVPSDEDLRTALEAEIESLRATRVAEIAQMGDIVETLDRVLGAPVGNAPSGQPAMVETPMPFDVVDTAEAEDADAHDQASHAASYQERG